MDRRGIMVPACAVLFALAIAVRANGSTIFVKHNASGANDGTSWANAYTSLQSAITAAVASDEIWVAAGTYKPTTGTDRTISFAMKSNVAIYGGFAGTESAPGERDVRANITILSGEIGVAGVGDNSYHVVRANGVTSSVLDGFTISGGNANGSGADGSGAGLRLQASATIRNCTFTSNSATFVGGAVYADGGFTPTLTSCTFRNNSAGSIGGALGMDTAGTSVTATNCVFFQNSAQYGGAVSVIGNGAGTFANCTFVSNTASNNGGAIYFDNTNAATVVSSILRSNTPNATLGNVAITYSNVQGGYAGTGNIDSDPLFAHAASGNFRLSPGSPSIDAGSNSGVPGGVTTDRDGVARFLDDPVVSDTGSGAPPIVDMGAYERVAASSYLLTVYKNGPGTGTVTSAPAGIDCGATCNASFNVGSQVTLTATPDTGYAFSGWVGGPCSGRGTCTVTMNAVEFVTASFGLVRYVDVDALGANDGTSWSDAFVSLQTALANVSAGTELWVAEGMYKPTTGPDRTISFALKSGIAVMGGFAGSETLLAQRNVLLHPTILSGAIGTSAATDNSYHVITDAGADDLALLDGFTITGGYANASFPDDRAGGLNLSGSAAIANCIVTGNTASFGGPGNVSGTHTFTSSTFQFNTTLTSNSPAGLMVSGGSHTFTNCTFNANSAPAGFGGGAYVFSTSTVFRGCRFLNMSGMNQGGGLYLGTGTHTIRDCIFSGNTATSGGAIFSGGTSEITNSLFTGNRGTSAGGALFFNGATTVLNSTFKNNIADSCGLFANNGYTVNIRNSVIWGNTGPFSCGAGLTITYSDVEGGFSGTGNINSDPLYRNAAYPGDGRLGTGSPAIDAGDNTVVPAGVVTDLDGGARFIDVPDRPDVGVGPPPIVDMGAYEFSTAPTGTNLSVALIGGGSGVVTSTPPGLNCTTTCSASFPTSSMVTLAATPDAGSIFSGWSGACAGTNNCVLTMDAAKSVFARFSRLRYVDADAAGANDGTSWADAFTSLQTALSNATAGTELWVAEGTYTPGTSRSQTFTIADAVTLYGGFAGTETARDQRNVVDHKTTLSGEIGAGGNADNSYHVVTFASDATANAILDGFTITGGNANGGGIDQVGGGVFAYASPQIRNCVFAGNAGTNGGGLFYSFTSTPGTPKLINAVFVGNSAQFGAALMSNSYLTMINCSVTANRATGSHAVYLNQSTNTIANTIIWNNPGGNLTAPGATVTYSIIEGGYAGTGNLNIDPMFADPGAWNLRLLAGSPAIDAGRNSDVPVEITTDADLAPRFVGASVDIGAHELSTTRLTVTKFGRGTGTVSGGAINCGTTCTATLPANTAVTLTATPDAGWTFNGWGGDCSGTLPCTVHVPANVTARFGKVWYVNAFASGANDGTTWTSAFTDLQNALAAAQSSDDIWVAAATYKPHPSNPSISFAMKTGVGVYGGFVGSETTRSQRSFATNVTTLSGAPSNHVVSASSVDGGATLDGFTITAGSGDQYGGGVYIDNSSPRVENCIISGNNSSQNGGGISARNGGSPTIAHSTISGNTSFFGAGVSLQSGTATVLATEVADNTGTYGAGLYAENGTQQITGSNIHNNTSNSGTGGGLYTNNSSLRILGSTFFDNTVNSGGGGGMYLNGGTPFIANTKIIQNHASVYGGVGVQAAATFINCTIADNTATSGAAGVAAFSPNPTLTNCILYGNTPDQVSGSPAITWSDVQNGFTGAGNINNDPLFTPAYRLGSNSPAIDAGSNVAAASLATDFEGKPRRVDAPAADTGIGTPPLVDMGAYEFYPVTITGPTPVSACLGTQATLQVTATGWGTLTYQWRKATVPINDTNSPTYTIPSVAANDQASYDVIVTDSIGTSLTSNAVMLTVTTPPSIDVHPQNLTRCPTTQATFTVTANGSNLTYQWRKNTTPIDGATSSSYTINSVVASDAGDYDVVISGSCSPPATSNAATLTVNTATSIGTHPQNLTVCAGQTANLSVTASGTNLTYQWRRGGVDINGATSPTYSITATTGDAGTYDVVVTGSCGTLTSNTATLTVNAAPSIVNFSPTSGGVGTVVTVSGSGFTGATAVAFNGTNAPTFTVNSDAQISATVPSGATTGPITVSKNGCANATSSTNFTLVSFGKPANLVAGATSATTMLLTWTAVGGANHYQIFRSSLGSPFTLIGTSVTAGYIDSPLTPNTTYRYVVRAMDGAGSPSPDSDPDLGTTILFTDDPLASIAIKAVHWTELRTAVNAIRAAANLSAATFTDPSLAGVSVKTIHLTELRNAIDPALSALAMPAITYTDPTPTAGTTRVKSAHVQEIRNAVK